MQVAVYDEHCGSDSGQRSGEPADAYCCSLCETQVSENIVIFAVLEPRNLAYYPRSLRLGSDQTMGILIVRRDPKEKIDSILFKTLQVLERVPLAGKHHDRPHPPPQPVQLAVLHHRSPRVCSSIPRWILQESLALLCYLEASSIFRGSHKLCSWSAGFRNLFCYADILTMAAIALTRSIGLIFLIYLIYRLHTLHRSDKGKAKGGPGPSQAALC